MNFLSLHDYRQAISLALAMEQPGRLYSLFRDLNVSAIEEISAESSTPSITGHPSVDEVIRTMVGSELAKLLRYVRDWNARAKTSVVAQRVLHAVVTLRSAGDVMAAFGESDSVATVGFADDGEDPATPSQGGGTALKELVDGLIPYTERHLARMDRLLQESYVVDFLLSEMDGMFGEADNEEMDVDDLEGSQYRNMSMEVDVTA
jgi:U3 small nucleolar RNA-associated protein 13